MANIFSDNKIATVHQGSRGTGRLRESPGSDPGRARAAQDGEDAQGAAQRGTESHARRGVDIFQPVGPSLPVIYDVCIVIYGIMAYAT